MLYAFCNSTMEDHTPPLPPSNNLQGRKKGPDNSSSRSAVKDVIHMERNRREKMTEFYTQLQSMVPQLFPRATRTRIIEETILHIKYLEEEIIALDALKKSKEASIGNVRVESTQSSSSIDVTVSGETVRFFGVVCSSSRPGLMTQVLEVFEKHMAEVLAATVACDDRRVRITVTALVLEDEDVEKIKGELMNI